MIELVIKGQDLYISNPVIAADTIDYLEAAATFSDDWNGASKFAHFQQGDKSYIIQLTDDKIRQEDHLNLGSGKWSVFLHGNTLDGKRITTVVKEIEVKPTGALNGEPLPEMPLPVAEQIAAIAQSVRDDADAGKFDGAGLDITGATVGQVAVVKAVDENGKPTEWEPGDMTGGGGGTTDHRKLTNRNLPDQHPMSAITGLETALEGKQPKGDYLTSKSVPEWAKQPNKPTYTAQEVGALSQAELQSGIDTALEQAKASGEFDGKDGAPGRDGNPGRDGQNGKPGADGAPGENGGYYTPVVTQPDPDHMNVHQEPSKPDMPTVEDVKIALPKASSGGGAPANASELPATVPSGLPPETEKNTQAVLNALAARPSGGSDGWKFINSVTIATPTDGLVINQTKDGQTFAYRELFMVAYAKPETDRGQLVFIPGSFWGTGEAANTTNLSNIYETNLAIKAYCVDSYGIVLEPILGFNNNNDGNISASIKNGKQNAKYEKMKSWKINGKIGAGTFVLFGKD